MGYAVSANPTAAMLENDGVGQRSGVRPLPGGVRSQKKLKVPCWSVSRNAAVSGETPGPPELLLHAPRARATATAVKRLRHLVRNCTQRRFARAAGRLRRQLAVQQTRSAAPRLR